MDLARFMMRVKEQSVVTHASLKPLYRRVELDSSHEESLG